MNVHQYIQAELRKLTPDELRNWCEIHGLVENPPRLRVRFATMSQWSPTHQQHVVAGLKNWCIEQNYADAVLRQFVLLDRRLAIWCACQVSRSVLRYISQNGLETSLSVIETVERWVRAEASESEVVAAAQNALEFAKRANDPEQSAIISACVPSSVVACSQWDGIGETVRHVLNCLYGTKQMLLSRPLVELISYCIPCAISAATYGHVLEQKRKDSRT